MNIWKASTKTNSESVDKNIIQSPVTVQIIKKALHALMGTVRFFIHYN